MKQEELNLILDNHKKWLNNENEGSRANLSDANLSNTDLSNTDLRHAYLSDANLSNTDLSNTDLRHAYLRRANLSDANLSDAYLSDAYLSDANLSNTDLSNTDLRHAYLRHADLSDAYLMSTIGNQREVITIQTNLWQIVYTPSIIQIGCQRHSIDDWFGFSDDRIAEMDRKAVGFWKKWKPILLMVMERES